MICLFSYAAIGEGKRKKKAKMFSYGGPHSMFRHSEQAEEAAIKRRIAEEALVQRFRLSRAPSVKSS